MEAYGGVEIEEMDYEEDTDDIPLMKFDCGKAGKHLLVVDLYLCTYIQRHRHLSGWLSTEISNLLSSSDAENATLT